MNVYQIYLHEVIGKEVTIRADNEDQAIEYANTLQIEQWHDTKGHYSYLESEKMEDFDERDIDFDARARKSQSAHNQT